MSPLVSLTSVSKSFGIAPLFTDISLVINERERTALVGPNGAGKSTLFKIIAGLADSDSGDVSYQKGLRVAYVSQKDDFSAGATVESTLSGVLGTHVSDQAARISRLTGMASLPPLETEVESLSGGFRKRLSIVRGVIQEPDLLLLDEPTNHLDIESILWLEDFLGQSRCAIVFISHDRYFIERLSTRVIELDRVYSKGFLTSNGGYSDFLEHRENFLSQQESYRSSLANKVRREVEWLRQGVKARGTKAKGRINQAGKMIDELSTIKLTKDKATFEFSQTERQTKELLVVKKVRKNIGERTLFTNLNITVTPGMRVGIAGANGSGKTTLLKVLLGESTPDSGHVRTARDLRVAYFDQQRSKLDETLTLREALCNGSNSEGNSKGDSVVFCGKQLHVASWAKRFLFSTDQLPLRVSTLSGGERARVLLSQIMLLPSDILVLDEPTNDLDIATLDALEETLVEFTGAVLLVTHDRHMLDAVCTHVIGLDGADTDVYADYEQFVATKAARVSQHKEVRKASDVGKERAVEQGNPQKKLTYAERLELEKIEAQIAAAEEGVSEAEAVLSAADSSHSTEWLTDACQVLEARNDSVAKLYARWEFLLAKADSETGS